MLLLAACGGGGGTSLIALDGGNGAPVAAQALAAAQIAYGAIDLAGAFGEILDGAPPPACDAGSLDLSVADAAPEGVLSTGDSLRLVFHGCGADVAGELLTLDGSLRLDVLEVVETPPAGRQVRYAATFGNLRMTFLAESVTLGGSVSGESGTADGISFTDVVTGDLVATAAAANGTGSVRLEGFRVEESVDDATGDYARGFSGTVSSSAMGGAVEMEDAVPFTGNGEEPPAAGECVLRGALGSEVRVVAMGGPLVRIFIDADGDGRPENTVDTTWNDLG
jgi:hypothetical protein